MGDRTTTVGFLHPGTMGAQLAATCSGDRRWVPAGRSDATRQRADAAGTSPSTTLDELADTCGTIVSICPPDAAEQTAADVAATGFDGVYVEANAIAPERARRVARRFEHFVDGGIVGPPPIAAGTTRLYLSGADAPFVASHWEGSPLEVRLVDGGAGAASAVKVSFAAWTKGTAALLMAVRALAHGEGVEETLVAEWATSMPDLISRAELTAPAVGPKAWRFVGEMEEIAAAFASNGLPAGFHEAAAEVYARMEGFKDAEPGPSLAEILHAMAGPS
jgi:3-hydroxyisobutyrate dehydrogenase-like beta-hydroxyacid dehydrogenase